MSSRLTIAVDTMGGDDAPAMVLDGAEVALERHPNTRFMLFGKQDVVSPLLEKMGKLKAASEFIHTDDVISADDKPSIALRTGRQSSMRLAINAVKNGDAAAVVSAGNTGALMAMSKFVLKTIKGVDRPAIASFFPTERGESVMLDLGANVSCDADNLVQFATMGTAFARSVLGVTEPSFGLLNVGSEELKGHEALQQAASRLRSQDSSGRYHGFVEGDDIARGTVDVVVTDGFSGNIALKTAEGTARLYSTFLTQTFRNSLMASLGYLLARPAMRKLSKRVDPRRYNGAVFLGLNGVAVKSHGGTDALGFAHALAVAIDLVEHNFIAAMHEDFSRLEPQGPEAQATAV